ncbi:MAG: hypothetical protein ABI779_00015 [Acidobacteriota bacterium]
MSHFSQRVIDSKRSFRRELAARPIGEKLRILDKMRERDTTIRRAAIAFKESRSKPR